ncbi:myelin regulatory factor-like isoform X2 [Dysidea avara]|uniref:myelin regulatory factor-like isoform X2 n=1 Tax=Dysidea avara TaxID=196820 RepID=UPI00332923A6
MCTEQRRLKESVRSLFSTDSEDKTASVADGDESDFMDAGGAGSSSNGVISGSSAPQQSLSWRAHKVDSWYEMCDATLQDIPAISFRVEANKGFTYSPVDECFVCQKKNHFQVTVTCQVDGTPRFIKMKDGGLQPIKRFILDLHGIKLESEMSIILLDQSLVDRSKKKLCDIEIELTCDVSVCKTIGRLHFSETTQFNMRKKGKPNPDQKYFSLVVALIAHTANGATYPVVAHVSERIIVRASNPGTFDNDTDMLWGRAASANSICYMGKVGINTEKPLVALSVHGSVQVSGKLLQPSDRRVKEDIIQIDPAQQLDNIAQLRVCQFSYTPEYTALTGSHDHLSDVGVVAQELQQVIPDAVECNGNLQLPNGDHLEGFLCVRKDRILMESIGAIQELTRLNHKLSARVSVLERSIPQWLPCQWFTSKSLKCPHFLGPSNTWRILLLLILVILSLILLTTHCYHGNGNYDNWIPLDYHIREGWFKHSPNSL